MIHTKILVQYAARDLAALEPYYSAHVSAMTSQGLRAKSAIAAELAFRDVEIAALRARETPESAWARGWKAGSVTGSVVSQFSPPPYEAPKGGGS